MEDKKMIKKISAILLVAMVTCFSGRAIAQTMSNLYRATADGQGELVGQVTFKDTDEGLEISYDLKNLPAGEHGFHVHEKADCSPMMKDHKMEAAMAAGGHYDPEHTGKHLGPEGNGHRGDLPVLIVNEDGTTKETIIFGISKNLKAEEFKGHTLMVHQGGDNYSDKPLPLGGGGARIACGVIE